MRNANKTLFSKRKIFRSFSNLTFEAVFWSAKKFQN